MYKRLLVPYDGSRPADRAVKHAFNIAKIGLLQATTREVNLLYVVQEMSLRALITV